MRNNNLDNPNNEQYNNEQEAENQQYSDEPCLDEPCSDGEPYSDNEQEADDEQEADEEQEPMSFWDHLEVFRWMLIRIIGAMAVFVLGGFAFIPWLFQHVVMAPSKPDFFLYRWMKTAAGWVSVVPDDLLQPFHVDIININLSSQFFLHMSLSVWVALLLAFPYIVFEVWRFVCPALYKNEQRGVRFVFVFGTVMFFMGCCVGYRTAAGVHGNLNNRTAEPQLLLALQASCRCGAARLGGLYHALGRPLHAHVGVYTAVCAVGTERLPGETCAEGGRGGTAERGRSKWRL